MACSFVSDVKSIQSGKGGNGVSCSVKSEDIPLTERQKLLHSSKRNLNSYDSNTGFVKAEHENALMPLVDAVVKKEYKGCDSQGVTSLPSVHTGREVVVQQLGQEQDTDCVDVKEVASEAKCNNILINSSLDKHSESSSFAQHGPVLHEEMNWQEKPACLCPGLPKATCTTIQTEAGGPEKGSANFSHLPQCPTLFDLPANIKFEDSDMPSSSVENDGMLSLDVDFPAQKVQGDIFDGIVDKLDHISLKDRQRMLLARCRMSNSPSRRLLEGIAEHSAGKVERRIHSDDGKTLAASNQCNDILEENNTSIFESPSSTITESSDYISVKSINSTSPHEEHEAIPTKNDLHCNLTSLASVKVKDEPWDNSATTESSDYISLKSIDSTSPCKEQDAIPELHCNLTSPTSVKVKDEPWHNRDNSDFHNVRSDAIGDLSINMLHVKSEWEVHNEYLDVQVENMSLRDRMRFLMSRGDSTSNTSTSYNSFKKDYASERGSVISSAEPVSIKRPRKRKKTATDSVETALEEDAPGLLQVLKNKGVTVNEIKLYGERESDEAMDESLCEDSFAELEAVISKLFSSRNSFIKFPPIRAGKASRATYCLTCLISLVEQARYLQFRKWPVEWGWCRDLQSFVFVFEKHNRIVLERPEYGYATYFFELVESLPIDWQIKRMVTAMKLTSCGRISLIENKALSVGEDLTEGEAQVLMDYGWVPNSGLGTMLNYCDRVLHDRKNEKDTSEWRSKIGKLLADGYNGGSIVAHNIPKKLRDTGLQDA